MFTKYLYRELTKRKKQTALIASGLAIAIALVMTVSAVAAGIKTAQSEALSGLYGIGTDIAVSKTATPGSGGQRFKFDPSTATGAKTQLSKSRLSVTPFTGTLNQKEIKAIAAVEGVKATVATLQMENTSFSGTLPALIPGASSNKSSQGDAASGTSTGQPTSSAGTTDTSAGGSPTNGSGSSGSTSGSGFGGGDFNISRFTVEGITVGTQKIGPLSTISVASGRTFTTSDANKYEAIVDASYASGKKLKVGSKISLAGKSFTVIGIIKANSTAATTPSNVYIPIAVAQVLSDQVGTFTNVYVKADSSQNLATIKSEIQKVAKGSTVSTSSDLASTVSGSLSTASNLVNNMGGWLSSIVLLAAFATAILFTTSGVNRRVREFGTLKAMGWRSRRVVGQVLGESLVNGLIGGISGIVLGLAGIWAVNNWAPTLSATLSQGGFGSGPGGGFTGSSAGGNFGGMMQSPMGSAVSTSATNITLHAPVEPMVILIAISFAVLGGLLAGAFGGLRAARLSPVTALRSVE